MASTLRSFLIAATAALVLTACNREPAAQSQQAPEPGDQAVATVNGQNVWASDVRREAVAQGLIAEGEPLDPASDQFRRVMDEVVDQKLLAAEALKRRIDKSPAAQRRLAAARDRLLGDMLVEGEVARAVNDQAVRGLYEETLKQSPRGEEVRARQIVLPNQADAEQVRRLLAAGGSFESLAMERSTDTATRFNGGDLGFVTPDVLPPATAQALNGAAAGSVVGPVPVQGGFALYRVEERRREEPISLAEARPQIVRFLTYDEVRDLLERLRGAATIRSLLPAPTDVPGAPQEPASAPAQPTAPAPAPKAAGK